MAHLEYSENTLQVINLSKNEAVILVEDLVRILGLGYKATVAIAVSDKGGTSHRIKFTIDSALTASQSVTIPAPAPDSAIPPIKE